MMNVSCFISKKNFDSNIFQLMNFSNFCVVTSNNKCFLEFHKILKDVKYTSSWITSTENQLIENYKFWDYSAIKRRDMIQFYSPSTGWNVVMDSPEICVTSFTLELKDVTIRIESEKFILDIINPSMLFNKEIY